MCHVGISEFISSCGGRLFVGSGRHGTAAYQFLVRFPGWRWSDVEHARTPAPPGQAPDLPCVHAVVEWRSLIDAAGG